MTQPLLPFYLPAQFLQSFALLKANSRFVVMFPYGMGRRALQTFWNCIICPFSTGDSCTLGSSPGSFPAASLTRLHSVPQQKSLHPVPLPFSLLALFTTRNSKNTCSAGFIKGLSWNEDCMCVQVCLCVGTCACVCVCLCAQMYLCIQTSTYMCVQMLCQCADCVPGVCAQMGACVQMCLCVHVYLCAHAPVCVCICMPV